MRWIWYTVAAFALLGLAAFFAVRQPAVQDAIIRPAAQTALAATRDALVVDDALRVILCGTSGPLPDLSRAKTCTLVIAGGKIFVVDLGSESVEVITRLRLPMARVAGVFITHLHSDHIAELGEFNMQSWAQGRGKPLPVFGPPGIERVVNGFSEAYALDQTYRTAHHGAELMDPAHWVMQARPVALDGLLTPVRNRIGVVLEESGLKVTALEASHSPVEPAYGYRFDYKGRSVVISGDTAKHEPFVSYAKDADLLLHEAQADHLVAMMLDAAKANGNARLAKIFADIRDYHATPGEAADIANRAGVKLLVFHHLTPPPTNLLFSMAFTRGVSSVRSTGWVLGEDGMLFTLPVADPERIDRSKL